jgi:hypothetical protein
MRNFLFETEEPKSTMRGLKLKFQNSLRLLPESLFKPVGCRSLLLFAAIPLGCLLPAAVAAAQSTSACPHFAAGTLQFATQVDSTNGRAPRISFGTEPAKGLKHATDRLSTIAQLPGEGAFQTNFQDFYRVRRPGCLFSSKESTGSGGGIVWQRN